MITDAIPDKIPFVGVGCIVIRHGELLLVRDRKGFWSTPGGHLDFGESPDSCAMRETLEETGISVSNVQFVAITNDLVPDNGKHYLTVWMRADADDNAVAKVCDTDEITEVGWFSMNALPEPLHVCFDNLLKGRCWPKAPANVPFVIPIQTVVTPC